MEVQQQHRKNPSGVQRDPSTDSKVEEGAVRSPATTGSGGGSDPARGNEARAQAVAATSVARDHSAIPKKPLKLDRYDGVSVPYETFVAKLNNATSYNQWTEHEKCVFLRDALIGNASLVLWELN